MRRKVCRVRRLRVARGYNRKQPATIQDQGMPISDIPLFSMLRTKMHWHQERQRVLAENVANADTPEFRPRISSRSTFGRMRPAGDADLAGPDRRRRISPDRGRRRRSRLERPRQVRRPARRQRGQPRGRDDEGRRQPDGLPGGDLALQPQHGAHHDRARQALKSGLGSWTF